jgi:threonylcarbamoyladenosine tRNA methylthiotransferase MtaB
LFAVDIVTVGCKVNHAESGQLVSLLERRGIRVSTTLTGANLAVVNTCAVTGSAAAESRKLVRRIRRRTPGARVIVCGCLGALEQELLAGLPGVEAVTGPDRMTQVLHALERALALPDSAASGCAAGCAVSHGRARPEVKIQDGCDSHCSYCVVPRARGPSRSVLPGEIVATVQGLAETGFHEVVLTGIHVGRYGLDLTPRTNLSALVDALAQNTTMARMRLSSLEPNELNEELLAAWPRYGARLCRHLHVPLQSGCDRVLARMRRPYVTATVRRTLERASALIDDLCLGVDVLVGHPGEDEAAFAETAAFLETLPLTYLHVFSFSARPGTDAAAMSDRPQPAIVKERAARLLDLDARLRRAQAQRQVGTVMEMVVERADDDGLIGTTDHYVPVLVQPLPDEGPRLARQLVKVHGTDVVLRQREWMLRARLVR